jgi:hypothetical protein
MQELIRTGGPLPGRLRGDLGFGVEELIRTGGPSPGRLRGDFGLEGNPCRASQQASYTRDVQSVKQTAPPECDAGAGRSRSVQLAS